MLFALAGMILMAMASDLLVIFLALEVLSLAVYVLTGIRRDSPTATEAAFKYFLLGAFSSAFFLYGIAFAYGVTGSTRLDRIGSLMAAQAMAPTPLQLVAMGLLLVGFAFKVSAVPFHMWTPDAYEGAPAPVTGFMSTGVKAAAFAAFARVFLSALEPLRGQWSARALGDRGRDDDRRHGGRRRAVERQADARVLEHRARRLSDRRARLGERRRQGRDPLLSADLRRHQSGRVRRDRTARDAADRNEQITDYAGLWNVRPGLAALMTIFLLSLGGFPPLAGFIAKWYVFTAAMKAGYTWLAIIGVLTSVVSVFFYLRIVVMMYMTPAPSSAVPFRRVPQLAGAALVVSAVIVIYLGILPARVLDWAAHRSARSSRFQTSGFRVVRARHQADHRIR